MRSVCEKINNNNIIYDTVESEAFDFRVPKMRRLQGIANYDRFYRYGTSNLTLKVSTSRPRWSGDKRFAMREVLLAVIN